MSRFVELNSERYFRGKRCLEIGAGTGLASIVAACQGAEVTATDRHMMLPLISHNCQRNLTSLCKSNAVHTATTLPSTNTTTPDAKQNKQNSGSDAKQNSSSDAKQNSSTDAKQNSSSEAKQTIGCNAQSPSLPSQPINVKMPRVIELVWGDSDTSVLHERFDVVFGSDLLYDSSTFAALMHTLLQFALTGATILLVYPKERYATPYFFSEACKHFEVEDIPQGQLPLMELDGQDCIFTIGGVLMRLKQDAKGDIGARAARLTAAAEIDLLAAAARRNYGTSTITAAAGAAAAAASAHLPSSAPSSTSSITSTISSALRPVANA